MVRRTTAAPAGSSDTEIKDLNKGKGTETEGTETEKRAYTKVTLADVPVDLLNSMDMVPEDEWVSHPLSEGPARSPAQVVVDEKVKAVHDDWIKAGRPSVRQSPRGRFTVAPDLAASVRHMIGTAARLHGIAYKISPPRFESDGREVLVFTVRDKGVRKKASANS